MPLYDYECECGHRFEELHSIEDRHNAVCPMCKEPAHLEMSAWGRVIIAGWDTVVDCNGIVVSRKQSTEQIPLLPERVHGGRF